MILFLCSSFVSQIDAVQPGDRLALDRFPVPAVSRLHDAGDPASTRSVWSACSRSIGGSLGFHAAKAGLAFIVGGGTRFADGLAGAFVDNNGYALGTVMIMPLLLATAQNIELV